MNCQTDLWLCRPCSIVLSHTLPYPHRPNRTLRDMSVPPNPNPNPIPTPSPNPSGYTHHVHHLGSLQGLHPSFDPKAIPGAPGQGGYHHYDHRLWNRQLQRGGCGTYQRAPVRTKVLWVSF